MMDTIEAFSGFLGKIGAHNFLAIGIVIVVLWLIVSGLRKGLRKQPPGQSLDDNKKEE